jgi:hypothetical protein
VSTIGSPMTQAEPTLKRVWTLDLDADDRADRAKQQLRSLARNSSR